MDDAAAERQAWLRAPDGAAQAALLARLSPRERRALAHHWRLFARPAQLAPPGDWQVWLICAGRGFGKTRAGAEWVRGIAARHPEARIALVASSLAEARAVMVEGESGLLRLGEPERRPRYEPSLRRVVWPNGAQAFLYSAAEPEMLRGPQHSHAWCDELGKWDTVGERAERSWDNLLLGLRLGGTGQGQVVATTTPRAVPLLRRLLAERAAEPGLVAVTRGTTFDNAANLPSAFVQRMQRRFGGTAFGRQELEGELLDDVEGALWSRALLERCRAGAEPAGGPPARVVIGVDPPASAAGDACGIVVCALLSDGRARVLADCSVERARPDRWARAVAAAASAWAADRVVAEANQGGAMVEAVLRAADLALPVRLVHATRGKVARAEPVAALYEAGRVTHAEPFARLEDELCGLLTGGGYAGPGRSPDRADALVWALTELLLAPARVPRVRRL
ncbi:ATP-binding protein [Erythrobacteraceae bacterium CFH 75059]|uniref:DNA-packaging protein n=1 Tax=Qipengyuania thermophila TaxID=2509361 RepID=UPI0010212AD9|nr:terminase family protein [Qipengyuania thermophila]TCD06852.1 ATP-binding protein [Erythrobacteraceae bacterium CFH 75059]